MEESPRAISNRNDLAFCLLVICAVFLAYFRSFTATYLFDDDYGHLASGIDFSWNTIGSGRPLYHLFLIAAEELFRLDLSRLVYLRLFGLLSFGAFLAGLHYGTRLNGLSRPSAAGLTVLIACLPVFQIMSCWMVAYPYYLAGAATLIATSLIVNPRGDSPAGARWRLVISVILLVCGLMIHQAISGLAISLLILFVLSSRADNWVPRRRRLFFCILSVLIAVIVYAVLAGLILRTTGVEPNFARRIGMGGAGQGIKEAFGTAGSRLFDRGNQSLMESWTLLSLKGNTVVCAFFLLAGPIMGLRCALRMRKTRGGVLRWLLERWGIIILLAGLCFEPRLLQPFFSYRALAPATVTCVFLWFYGAAQIYRLLSSVFPGKAPVFLADSCALIAVVFALWGASFTSYQSIIKPASLELGFVMSKLEDGITRETDGIYLVQPGGNWDSTVIDGHRKGMFGVRLSTRFSWVPRGIVRVGLKSMDHRVDIPIAWGGELAAPGKHQLTIDMNELKEQLITAASSR